MWKKKNAFNSAKLKSRTEPQQDFTAYLNQYNKINT